MQWYALLGETMTIKSEEALTTDTVIAEQRVSESMPLPKKNALNVLKK